MRSITPLLLCLLISFTWAATLVPNTADNTTVLLSNMETLQQLCNGWFEHAKLPKPVTMLTCHNEESAKVVVDFVRTALQQLADKKFTDVEKTLDKWEADTPQSIKDCLHSNEEYKAVTRKYNIYEMRISEMKKRIKSYAVLHMPTLTSYANDMNKNFKGGNFYATSDKAGDLAQKVFGGKFSVDQDHKHAAHTEETDFEIVQHFITGFFSIVNLPEPKTVVQCLNPQGQHDAAVLIGGVLKDLDNNNFNGVNEKLDKFLNTLPKESKDCWDNNDELTAALKAYKIYGQPASAVKAKVVLYVITHIIQLKIEIKKANQEWDAGKHTEVGKRFGNLLKKIF